MKLQIVFFFCLLIVLAGCQRSSPAVIFVGQNFDEAQTLLDQIGAKEEILAMQPPRKRDGSFLELRNFRVSATTVVSIVVDDLGSRRITGISVCSDISKPKDKTIWVEVERFDLKAR